MLNIFKGDPRDWFLGPSEPYPWWDGLLQTLRQMICPALGFAAPGAIVGCTYALHTGQSIAVGVLVGAVSGFALLYFVLSLVEEVRRQLKRFIDNLNPFG